MKPFRLVKSSKALSRSIRHAREFGPVHILDAIAVKSGGLAFKVPRNWLQNSQKKEEAVPDVNV